MVLLLDLDNTLLPSKSAYKYAIEGCQMDWDSKSFGGDFLVLYEAARAKIKNQLKGHSSNRLRLLCFKIMLEDLNSGTNTATASDMLWLEDRYNFHFAQFLKKESQTEKYTRELFPKLINIAKEKKIILCTNETLRMQLIKLSQFFPKEFLYTLVTSEEVGQEKPSTEFFSYVLKLAGNEPNVCFMIGDNWDDDVLGAAKHGIVSIHLVEQFGVKHGVSEISSEFHVPIYTSSNIIESLDFALSRFT
jgi:putative hydrolase of the HAD superfamily